MSTADQKTCLGLLETVMWICTRDEERVAAMWDMTEEKRMPLAMISVKAQLDPRSLLIFAGRDTEADRDAAVWQAAGKSSRIDEPGMMRPDQALKDLLRKVQSGRVQMTAIRCDGSSDEQIRVSSPELNDLTFRISPGHRAAPVGLWSRSRDTAVWRSPQFLRADVIRVWPPRNTKTAAVSGAILRHLRQIMTPEAPLTRLEAQQRCMAEVPNAYPGAFKKAWAELEASSKRGRGKHGPRGH
jgi:hypothetical protein